MTGRELSGWVPSETHTHYAPDGTTVTGYTVVERESRINDADRADLLALMQYQAAVCDCGFHPSIATDTNNVFQPGSRVCPVCAGAAVWQRVLSDGDEKATSKDAPPTQPRPSDGRRAYMSLLSPQQAAAEREKRKGGEHGHQA